MSGRVKRDRVTPQGHLSPIDRRRDEWDDVRDPLPVKAAEMHRLIRQVASEEMGDDLRARGDYSDLVQDVFLEVIRCQHQFRGSNDLTFIAWIASILKNRVKSLRRRVPPKREVLCGELGDGQALLDGIADDGDSPSQDVMKAELQRLASRAFSELDEPGQSVIRMHYIEGVTFQAIGDRLGVTDVHAGRLYQKALARLRRRFRAYCRA